MNTLVIASNNKNKLKEFKEMLKGYNILCLEDIGYLDDIIEDGKTFEENALIKARTIHKYLKEKKLNYIVMSEDSGLCVNSLDGAPGVYSARYAKDHDIQANRNKLLKELEGRDRSAFFSSTIVVYYPNDQYKIFVGETYGEITKEEIGKKDFGYDCIFFSKELEKTFGQATEEEKNSVSHRGRAIKKMIENL